MANVNITGDFAADVLIMDTALHIPESFDIIKRELRLTNLGGAVLYYIDGFVKDEVTEKLMEFMIKAENIDMLRCNIPYVEVTGSRSIDEIIKMVLSGATALFAEGLGECELLDTRTYPTRSITEPENDKVLRGSRDGFTEALIFNTALIRRRIRTPELTFALKTVGESTKTDVAVCYIKGRADDAFVNNILSKIDAVKTDALSMGQQSLAECLIKTKWYNPFPKIRYTERPDSAAAMLLEGSVIVLCDNVPSVMLLPTSIFDFMQEADDFYFPPFTGTYLRLLRISIFFITLILTPLWYLLTQYEGSLPDWLSFAFIGDGDYAVPLILQLFLIEFCIDGLKLASMNTPSTLNNSLSVVGGLILGDFAVEVGWFVPEVILYMAFVAIANFTQPSYELGYAFKFMRLLLLALTALLGIWGFVAGIITVFVLVATNKTVDGSRSYLYPVIPFNAAALKRLILRIRL